MADAPRRYLFHPLERRGVVLGLQATQVVVLAAGVALALLASRAAPGAAEAGVAVAILASSALLALWTKGGRPLAGWVVVVLHWTLRRAAGPRLADRPLAGHGTRLVGGPPAGASTTAGGVTRLRAGGGQRPEPAAPDGVRLIEVPPIPGDRPLGIVQDRRFGTWAAVVPVGGSAFSLLDGDEQVSRLEGWRTVLGTLARAGTPLRRVQWVQRSTPSPAAPLLGTAGGLRSGPAADSYRELLSMAAPTVRAYDAWLVLCVGDGRRAGGPGRRCIEQLAREVRLLAGQLHNAELQAGDPLDLHGLRQLLGQAHQPEPARSTGSVRPWPLASDEAWSALRTDGTWNATYWIAEWPRVEVNPDFLTPLLLGQSRRTLSVVMAPIPADRAMREVRAARTADVADEELRTRAGFLPSARRHREAEGVARREAELADGHAEYRFSGYVTVTAGDRDSLEAACVEAEQAAQSANLQLLRLFGRQAEAYTWTLPLGRGLA